jgi:hypothetical protein
MLLLLHQLLSLLYAQERELAFWGMGFQVSSYHYDPDAAAGHRGYHIWY